MRWVRPAAVMVVVAAVWAMATPSAVASPGDVVPVAAEAGLTDEVVGDASTDAHGVSTSNYDIGYDAGAWNQWDRKFLGAMTALGFEWNKLLTRGSSATVRWAFEMDVARGMASQVDAIASRYQQGLWSGSVAIYDLVLFAALVWCGLALLRGRTVQATGELAVSWLVVVAFGVFVVAAPGGFARLVTGTVDVADGLSASVVAATLDDDAVAGCPAPDATDAAAMACPYQQALHGAFVERPYDLLNWGGDLSEHGLAACAQARTEILADGPHGASDTPRNRMREAGTPCEPLADFNQDPTAERMMVAAAMGVVATLVLVLAGLIAATLIAAQLLLVVLVAVLPFAVLAGVVPGSGRAVLWRWAAGLVRVVLVAVAMAMVLALYLMLVNGLLDATSDAPWLAQALTLVVATLSMFVVRSRMVKASKRTAERSGQRLGAARIGGSHGGGMPGGWHGGPGYRGLDPRRYVPGHVRQTAHDVRRAGRWTRNHMRPRRESQGAATHTMHAMSRQRPVP